MNSRLLNVKTGTSGRTAPKGTKTHKSAPPSTRFSELGNTESNRRMELRFNGAAITNTCPQSVEAFLAQKHPAGHDLRKLCYYDDKTLCTVIYADFTDYTLLVENHTNNLTKTALGRNDVPTWEDFMVFLEERCIPHARAGLREYLEALGLEEYNPLEIIKKTAGRMAEDNQWLAWTVFP